MKTNPHRINALSRIILILAAGLLVLSLFVPIWRIELDAPQYPEGLVLQIYAHKIGGDVDTINGLNHYIGMKTLHTEDFIEFTLLPYIIVFFAVFAILTALLARKKVFYVLLGSFVLFGILSMVDFYRWNYDYGHDLDPKAAIKVPGMAYQPPLIGYKQLLNFGAYSIPDTGGWFFIGSGVWMLLVLFISLYSTKKKTMTESSKTAVLLFLTILFLGGCADFKPQPIRLNKDNCALCVMTVANERFGAELITEKGRVYKFDDISCMVTYTQKLETPAKVFYITDYLHPEVLMPAEEAFYIFGEQVKSPMQGNVAAFGAKSDAEQYAQKLGAEMISWGEVQQKFQRGSAHMHH